MSAKRFVILGNSAAAVHAIKAIRQLARAGKIVLVSAEQEFAYSPVLTTYLIGRRIERKEMFIADAQFYKDHDVETLFGVKAKKVDPEQKQIVLDDGRILAYDACLIATGSSPKELGVGGAELEGVFYLKTIADAEKIVSHSAKASGILVIGGGLIGLQAASSLHGAGRRVTMLVGSTQLLSQNVDTVCAGMLAEALQRAGVEILFETSVCEIKREGNSLSVVLNHDKSITADMMVIGKGVQANSNLVADSKIAVNCGILVDEYARTNYADVYAAGDVAEGPNLLSGTKTLVANWLNACRQGHAAGRNMTGQASTYFSLSENVTTVFGTAIAVLGTSTGDHSCEETIYHNPGEGVYRKIVCNEKGELVGAVLLNEIGDIGLLSTAIRKRDVIDKAFAQQIVRTSFPLRV
jgi:NAD(P)H-nitrite reductase large subunit